LVAAGWKELAFTHGYQEKPRRLSALQAWQPAPQGSVIWKLSEGRRGRASGCRWGIDCADLPAVPSPVNYRSRSD